MIGLPGRERNLTMTMPSAVWIQYQCGRQTDCQTPGDSKGRAYAYRHAEKMGNAPLLFPSFLSLPLSSHPSPIAKRHPENQLWGLGSAATPPATPRPQTHFGVFSAPKLHVAATLLHKLPMKKTAVSAESARTAFQRSKKVAERCSGALRLRLSTDYNPTRESERVRHAKYTTRTNFAAHSSQQC